MDIPVQWFLAYCDASRRQYDRTKGGPNSMGKTENPTVVGIFDDYKTAERAVHDLTSAGIPRDAINIQSNFMTGAAGRSTESGETQEGGISGFFHRLFGGED